MDIGLRNEPADTPAQRAYDRALSERAAKGDQAAQAELIERYRVFAATQVYNFFCRRPEWYQVDKNNEALNVAQVQTHARALQILIKPDHLRAFLRDNNTPLRHHASSSIIVAIDDYLRSLRCPEYQLLGNKSDSIEYDNILLSGLKCPQSLYYPSDKENFHQLYNPYVESCCAIFTNSHGLDGQVQKTLHRRVLSKLLQQNELQLNLRKTLDQHMGNVFDGYLLEQHEKATGIVCGIRVGNPAASFALQPRYGSIGQKLWAGIARDYNASKIKKTIDMLTRGIKIVTRRGR